MPTNFGRNYKRDRQRSAYRSRANTLARKEVRAVPPWKGYCPDLPIDMCDWSTFKKASGIISSEGALVNDDGWVRSYDVLGSNPFPLGNTATLPASTGSAVIGLWQWPAQSVVSELRLFLVAVTAGDGATINSAVIHTRDDTGAWISRKAAGTFDDATIRATTFHGAPLSDASQLWDSAVFVGGCPNRARPIQAQPAGSHTRLTGTESGPGVSSVTTSLNINRSCMVMTCGVDSPVLVIYHNDSNDLEWGQLTSFGGALNNTDATTWMARSFSAQSVCNFDERAIFANTTEWQGTSIKNFPQRVRWSAIGDPSVLEFIDSYTDADGSAYDWPAVGVTAGALDLNEFSRELVRVLPIGDKVAAYARDGIAFLVRTDNVDEPFYRTYVERRRGAIASRAVCPVSRDIHFFIGEDGFFLIDSEGSVTPVGINEAGAHKWNDTFFSTLATQSRDRITCAYDSLRHLVRIAWPAGSGETVSPNRMWNLDIATGNLWPDEYSIHYPTYLSFADTLSQSAVTWAALTSTWSSEVRTWADFGAKYAFARGLFGTAGGVVFGYSDLTHTRDGQEPFWQLESSPTHHGDPTLYKTGDLLWGEYVYTGPYGYLMGFYDGEGTRDTHLIALPTTATLGSLQTVYTDHRLTHTHLGWTITGSGAVRLESVKGHLIVSGDAKIRE